MLFPLLLAREIKDIWRKRTIEFEFGYEIGMIGGITQKSSTIDYEVIIGICILRSIAADTQWIFMPTYSTISVYTAWKSVLPLLIFCAALIGNFRHRRRFWLLTITRGASSILSEGMLVVGEFNNPLSRQPMAKRVFNYRQRMRGWKTVKNENYSDFSTVFLEIEWVSFLVKSR